MRPGLALRMSQHLSLTPQLQQSIRLLQLSTIELEQEVEQMLDENPFLERAEEDGWEGGEAGAAPAESLPSLGAESHGEASGADSGEMADWSDAPTETLSVPDDWEGDTLPTHTPDESEWGMEAAPRNGAVEDDDTDAVDLAGSHESLTEFLHRQSASLRLSREDQAALYFLIESLNDDGYLEDSLEALAQGLAGSDDPEEMESLLHHFTVALRLLQSLEPVGVGARDMAECLRLQLQAQQEQARRDPLLALEEGTFRIALRMCAQPMEWLARRDTRRLAQACGCTEVQARAALAVMARLEPKPGRRFVNVERHAIVPDVIVRRVGTQGTKFSVQLNQDILPRLRVQEVYARALRGHRQGEAHAALQQRLQEARWFIKNVQQRFDTILRVSRAIVERQKNFFIHGELAMRPLVLRDIADELGLHESTISRVTTAKYMDTPHGTFELKYFFGSGLGTDTGGNASSTAVRALIRQFISAENPKKPLSDSQLAEMLKEQGIECARRTVAKYREALKIPVATLRKAL